MCMTLTRDTQKNIAVDDRTQHLATRQCCDRSAILWSPSHPTWSVGLPRVEPQLRVRYTCLFLWTRVNLSLPWAITGRDDQHIRRLIQNLLDIHTRYNISIPIENTQRIRQATHMDIGRVSLAQVLLRCVTDPTRSKYVHQRGGMVLG